jgi:hypothetical protein
MPGVERRDPPVAPHVERRIGVIVALQLGVQRPDDHLTALVVVRGDADVAVASHPAGDRQIADHHRTGLVEPAPCTTVQAHHRALWRSARSRRTPGVPRDDRAGDPPSSKVRRRHLAETTSRARPKPTTAARSRSRANETSSAPDERCGRRSGCPVAWKASGQPRCCPRKDARRQGVR